MKKSRILLTVGLSLALAQPLFAQEETNSAEGVDVEIKEPLPVAEDISDQMVVGAILPKPLEISNEDPPVRLRDRLIMVEKRFVENAFRMDAHEKEVASLLLRVKTLEQMLYEQGPVVLAEPSSDVAEEQKPKVKPYRFTN